MATVFACQCLDKYLHATSKAQHQMECGLLLDIVIGQIAVVFMPDEKLFAGEDEVLLIRKDIFLIPNFCLHVVNPVRLLNIESDRLAGQKVHKDLHCKQNGPSYTWTLAVEPKCVACATKPCAKATGKTCLCGKSWKLV